MIKVSDTKVTHVHVTSVESRRNGPINVEVALMKGDTPLGKSSLLLGHRDPTVLEAFTALFDALDRAAASQFFESVGVPRPATSEQFEPKFEL